MKIIIDAMGGDNAPGEIVRGAALAVKELKASVILVGNESIIRRELGACGDQNLIGAGLELVHADEVITMEDDPFDVVRKKKKSSMAVGLRMLADGKGDAFVGAGNTGALFTGATMIVRACKGIRRAAIATVIPFERPMLLLDSGANIVVTAEYMEQFAFMGAIYMEKICGVKNPAVGLLNNGTEAHKGTPVYVETHELLAGSPSLNFVGNVEGKDLPKGKCDVLVADGFTGNVTLKLVEGMGAFMMKKIKSLFLSNIATKMTALFMKKQFMQLKKDFDASEYGGSPFLGISKPVIKAHGSSDALAIKNAVRQAVAYIDTGVTEEIARRAEKYVKRKPGDSDERSE